MALRTTKKWQTLGTYLDSLFISTEKYEKLPNATMKLSIYLFRCYVTMETKDVQLQGRVARLAFLTPNFTHLAV